MSVWVSERVFLQKPIQCWRSKWRLKVCYTLRWQTTEITYMAKIQYSILPFGIESVSYFILLLLCVGFVPITHVSMCECKCICALNWTHHHFLHRHTVRFPFSISSSCFMSRTKKKGMKISEFSLDPDCKLLFYLCVLLYCSSNIPMTCYILCSASKSDFETMKCYCNPIWTAFVSITQI